MGSRKHSGGTAVILSFPRILFETFWKAKAFLVNFFADFASTIWLLNWLIFHTSVFIMSLMSYVIFLRIVDRWVFALSSVSLQTLSIESRFLSCTMW